MAKILTTKGSAAALEDIIRKATKEIYIISFSYIISDSFLTRIRQAVERGVVINLVYGKSIKDVSYEQLKGIANVKIFHYENLHAKIFANETKCIIGSMNFSEASEINNTELGVMLSLQNDQEAFEDAIGHCKEIVREAKLERPMMPKKILDENKRNGVKVAVPEQFDDAHPQGYCIRTGKRIPLNHEKPYSLKAYDEWMNWGGNETYGEKYDHFTGEQSHGETCFATPILNKNWKKYQKQISNFFF